MDYTLNFDWLADYVPMLVGGVLVTVQLTLTGAALGVAVGIFCAWVRTQGPRALRPPVVAYIEFIRNTPFIVQLFFIFFGLPAVGIQLSEMTAASIAMIINLGAYSAEIIRGGIEGTHKGQYEAGVSLAMTRNQVFRYVVLLPALQRVWPALASQIVIVMLGSAVVSQIAAEDLTAAANMIQSRTFRPFEVYFVTIGIYLALAILVRQALGLVGRLAFPAAAAR